MRPTRKPLVILAVLEVVAHRGEQIGDVVVVQRIERAASVASHADKVPLSQHPELLGGGGLAHLVLGGQFFNGALALEHRPEQA